MSEELFDPSCTGCLPVAINPETGVAFGEETPLGAALLRAWGTLSSEEHQAFHRVCCLNSRTEADLAMCEKLTQQVQVYLQSLSEPPL